MKLYHNPRSRSGRPHWLIEEIGLDVERVHVDFAKGEHKSPEHVALNPLGQLPTLVDGDTVITESAAICIYLADVYGEQLTPPKGPARGAYYRWLVYPIGTLEPRAMALHRARVAEDVDAIAKARASLAEAIQPVEDAVSTGPWLLGDQFTAADVMMGATLMYFEMVGATALPPAIAAWCDRLKARDAWKRAHAGAG